MHDYDRCMLLRNITYFYAITGGILAGNTDISQEIPRFDGLFP